MENIVTIERPMTVKQMMNAELDRLPLNGEFPIDATERSRWATHICVHVHPLTNRRYSVITDRKVVPSGKAIIRRIK